MTPCALFRPVLLSLAGLATASCGAVDSDPRRFESMARSVSEISLDAGDHAGASGLSLRPAILNAAPAAKPGALRVEVMDPHDLWDARDAGLRGFVKQAASDGLASAEPAASPAGPLTERAGTVPAILSQAAGTEAAEAGPQQVLQLGAFSSPAGARSAWTRISAAGAAVARLTPEFETVEVDGRVLIRLRVTASSGMERAVCRAADAVDLGCLRRG